MWLTPQQVEALSKIPPKQELYAMVVGGLQSSDYRPGGHAAAVDRRSWCSRCRAWLIRRRRGVVWIGS